MVNKEKISKKKIAFIVFLVISLFWFAGAIGWYFIYQPVSETNTTEYTVTINKIQPITFYSISTNEHKAKFGIFSEEVIKDIDALNNLTVDQTITIRIKNTDIASLDNSDDTIWIVSLKTYDSDIITIDSYNENNAKMQLQACLGFCVGGVLCLITSIVIFLWDKGKIVKS
ncbi:MAG: hypothetical protein IJB10_03050 [Clostridia bacterium]|nr:hypothetical protein [Clostridia bacterium]